MSSFMPRLATLLSVSDLPEIKTTLPEIETALPEFETALPEFDTHLLVPRTKAKAIS